MATSLLVLLDDIATVLDDVAAMTKVAAKKTAGVLGDDLALNAEQVSGVRADRELPVVWAVFKGSALNKVILVPAALAISAVAPWLIVYLLILGGLYLCFEGVEKVWHSFAHKKEINEDKKNLHEALVKSKESLVEFEREKIKGAIRTDFILSAEIIVIALGSVGAASLLHKSLVVSIIAASITIGVYGLVGLIVKLDDIGIALMADKNQSAWAEFKRRLGLALLWVCPWLMKTLAYVGTLAMFLVGGGILVHGLPFLHHLLDATTLPFPSIVAMLLNLVVGLLAGTIAVSVFTLFNKMRGKAVAH